MSGVRLRVGDVVSTLAQNWGTAFAKSINARKPKEARYEGTVLCGSCKRLERPTGSSRAGQGRSLRRHPAAIRGARDGAHK